MSGTTWTKFYWSDWESDPALRLCSLAAQGLWMRMLCIASAHDPIGYVAVAGRGLDETALARMTGCPESEVADLLGELDRNGVFSRDRTGRIYSRRMVSDAKKASIARKFGKEGGNPKLTVGYNKPGFVYLMGVRSDGAYKIGISNNPENRLKKVRAQYKGQDLNVIEAWRVEDMGASEAEAHALFPKSKRSGEWFFLNALDLGKLRDFFGTLKGSEKGGLKTQKPEARSQIYSEDKSSDAIRVVVDHSAEAWTRAVRLLTERGMSPDKARSLFGRLLRDHGLEPRDLLPALVKATVNGTQDPASYLTRSAQGLSKRRAEPVKPKRVGWV